MPEDNDAGHIPQPSRWSSLDETTHVPSSKGIGPVRYLDDAPDDLWRDRLLWFFFPSLALAITGWDLLHQWIQAPEWVGWVFLVADLLGYALIAWRGPKLVSVLKRWLGRPSKLA